MIPKRKGKKVPGQPAALVVESYQTKGVGVKGVKGVKGSEGKRRKSCSQRWKAH